MADDADRLIALLDLAPHPEGGFYRETFRDARAGGRAHSTAIYFLLRAEQSSGWHRVDATEVWHWYAGGPLELQIADGDGSTVITIVLGNDFARGERPQVAVPAHAWQRARPLGTYTLAGCTVAPGFEFSKFELAPEGWRPF